jgi:hypothetical protein
MFKVDDFVTDSMIVDLLVADTDALNAMFAAPAADVAASAPKDGDAALQPMSMSRLIKVRELDEF